MWKPVAADALREEDLALARAVAGAIHRRLPWAEREDLIADGYEALLSLVPLWTINAPRLPEADRQPWLAVRLRNKIVDAIRAREGSRLARHNFRAGMLDVDGPLQNTPGASLHDVIPDPSQDTHRSAVARMTLEEVATLPEAERATFAARGDKDIAHSLGVTESRVSQLRTRGRERIAAPKPARNRRRRSGLLSPREFDVLLAAARGLSAQATAHELLVSLETVKTTRKKMLARLGASGVTNAVHIAHQRGILGGGPGASGPPPAG